MTARPTAQDIEARYPQCEDSTDSSVLSRGVLARAQGCLLGQLAGDSLGSLVEFKSEAIIRGWYPDGIRALADGGTFNTLAGQPTDDSEMALMLARSIILSGGFDAGQAAIAYAHWFGSHPFDCGTTTSRALGPALSAFAEGGRANSLAAVATSAADRESQANGALMRISPLAIFAHALPSNECARLAREDAALTHPHPVCQDANAVYAVAVSHAIATGATGEETYTFVTQWASGEGSSAGDPSIESEVRDCLARAAAEVPKDFMSGKGWVLLALQNAFWQLLHAPGLEAGVIDTVMRGGDTDTNAAVAGALLGAVWGRAAVPVQWQTAVLSCRPERGRSGVRQPRPRPFWPVDALCLARRLAEMASLAGTAGGRR